MEVPGLEKEMPRRVHCIWKHIRHRQPGRRRLFTMRPTGLKNLGLMTASTLQISEACLSYVTSDGVGWGKSGG